VFLHSLVTRLFEETTITDSKCSWLMYEYLVGFLNDWMQYLETIHNPVYPHL